MRGLRRRGYCVNKRLHFAAVALAWTMLYGEAYAAAPCRTSGPFNVWLAQFKQEAAAQGISQSAIAKASPYLVYDQRIVNIDRGQRVFAQSFIQFSGRMVPGGRISRRSGYNSRNTPTRLRAPSNNTASRALSLPGSGDWKATSARSWARRVVAQGASPRWHMTAGARRCFAIIS